MDAVVNVVDEVQLCQLVPVLPRSFPLRRLMRQVITTTKLSSSSSSSDNSGTGSHHRQTEGGLKKEESEQETAAAAAAAAAAAVQVRCRNAYRKYLYRVVVGMYPGCRGPATSPALFHDSVVGDDKTQDGKPVSSSSASGEGSGERSSNNGTTGSTTAGSEWMTAGRRLYRTLRPLLLSGQSAQQHTTTTTTSSSGSSSTTADDEEAKNDEERVMRLLLLALGGKAEKAVNQKGCTSTKQSSTTGAAAGPSPPSVAMVEWETGDVDLTEDTEGIMLEQQLRLQRSFYMPPVPLHGEASSQGERVSDTKEGTASTATPRSLREAAARQISRLGLFYRERMSSVHRQHARTLRTGDASGPSPNDGALNHPCHCTAACGHWAAEYVQVPHHTQSNNGNEAVTPVLLYTDALAQRSTLFMLNAKGLPRPLRWMMAAPTTSQHSLPPSRPSAADMLAGQEKAAQLHFSFFDRSRIRFEAVREERRMEAQSLLSRLLESCGSGSASAQQQQGVVQAINELWNPSDGMPEGVERGEVDEATIALRRAALQSFHDDVTDNLLVVSMQRDGAPHHNRLVPPSVALGYLLCDDLEAVLVKFDACFATMGNGREEEEEVDEESSISCRFTLFCDIFISSVSLYLTLHAPSLLSQQPFQDLKRRYHHHQRSGNDDTADLQEGGRPSLFAFPLSSPPSQHLDDTSGLDVHHIVLLSFLCVAKALRQRCEELTGLVVKALTHTLHQRVLVMYDLIRSSLPAAPSSFNCDSPVTGSGSAPLSGGYATPSAAASATHRFAAQHTSPEQQQRYVTWYEGQPSPAGLLNLLQHSGLWSGALRQLFSTWLSEDNTKCSKTTAEDHHSQQQPPTGTNSTGAGSFLRNFRGGESPAGESPSSSSVSPPSPPPQAHTAPSFSSSSAGLPADITEFSLLSQNFLYRSVTVLCGAEAAGWLSHAAAGTPLMTPAKKKPRTAAAGGSGSGDTGRRKRHREEEEEAAAAAAAAAISMPYYLAGPSVAAPLLTVRSSSTVFPDAFTSPGLFAGRVLVCVLQRAGRTLTFAELMRYIMYLSEASEGGGSGGGGGYTGMRLSDRRKRSRTAASSSTANHSSHHRSHPEDEDDEEEHSTPLPSPLAAAGAAPRKRGRPRKVVPGAAPPHH